MDSALFKKLNAFCIANGADVKEYADRIIREHLDLVLYGDLNSKMRKEKAEDVTPEPVAPADLTPGSVETVVHGPDAEKENGEDEPEEEIPDGLDEDEDEWDDDDKEEEEKEPSKGGRREIKCK